ncbi:MAG TPA: glycosyltransferase [Deltaproteobacteria bacterium]|nr:glycosyltransferase [Deltaproteobacteria bacterium]OQC29523.1 MAG: Glucosyl-3-phosphoglycerate synthase [Deltaproteobacteria bacterium ADurb.Bin072]HRW81035.1 glycosyltransferase [Desulfomonilia bacterium]NMD41139.1 glycosyltransferase [Deltaproteobacteria bacterium]HNQ84470.1 glycosyltransferase [Deltaproteobacteria bacterium]
MTSTRRFSTALRDYAREKIERLGNAEILVGIPSYLCDNSIVNVIKTVRKGLDTHYNGARALIMISDGGSTDDTRDTANAYDVKSFNIEKIITIYRGLPGKGSALRAIFEVANFLKPKAVAVFDSDLVSISPLWIKNLIEPVLNGYDFVAPDYMRYKFDATITNSIAYNLTRSLYGCRIRQPIGGDFGVSPRLAKHYLDQEDVWETDIARFGVDIWMTTTAIVGGFNICQARLGVKIHGEKDPAGDLGPMYRQVVGTSFRLMEMYQDYWKQVKGSRDIPSLGDYPHEEPAPFEINQDDLIEYFQTGYYNFGGVWRQVIDEQDMAVYRDLAEKGGTDIHLPTETWVRTVYRYANAFHSTPRQRMKVLNTMIPLYYARVASLVNELKDKDARQSEAMFQDHAQAFEDMKGYLLQIWS